MSWIFLAGERVFKLKKPVRYSYLDFATLKARERYCREETRLNRRLAPGVYRGVVPLTCSSTGVMTLGGGGKIVDWVVEMQRLPADCMLDVRLKEGRVGEEDIGRLAEVLANFYRHAEHPAVGPDMLFRHFMHEMAENRAVLLRPDLWSDQSRASMLLDQLEAVLRRISPQLRERAQSGCVVDGHGDLRPEHVCLTDPIVIFDCLEFNRDLRLVDPYDELTFLGMECARLNAAWFGRAVIERVAELMGDKIPHDLLDIYTALHAVLRSRLSLAHLLDPVPREPQKWGPQARQYLDLAEGALASLP
ncbi:hypothetical protein [Microvirga sp. M2]|uniref:hypothetical protein n=1 Tax=Microvirga sp. M2 TaxID=3073270 RepID=UPI0039C36AD9